MKRLGVRKRHKCSEIELGKDHVLASLVLLPRTRHLPNIELKNIQFRSWDITLAVNDSASYSCVRG